MRLAVILLIAGCGRIDFDPADPVCNRLRITIRDFTDMHADFHYLTFGKESGIVAPQLGADRTPTYAGGSTTSAASFRDWYHDTADNRRVDGVLPYTPGGPAASFGSDPFLPIDDQGFADTAPDQDGQPRNYLFTVELHARFTAAPGQAISVTSDDDSWLFIDRRLVIDLGGVHGKATDLYDTSEIGPGDHELDLFYAERSPPGAILLIQTPIACLRAN
jgi:fibro-slime domain-containing protein